MRCGALAAVVALAGCGGGVEYRPVGDVPVRVGKPYSVRGVTYVPAADPGYDYLGYASWYGGESGNRTAHGERFRPQAVTAAPVKLPLPRSVEVPALGTGGTLLVRVNDSGPLAGHRKSVVWGKSVSVRVDLGGVRFL